MMVRVCTRCRNQYVPPGVYVCTECRARAIAAADRQRARKKAHYDANADRLRANRRAYGQRQRIAAGRPSRAEQIAARDAPIIALRGTLGRIPKIQEIADLVGTSYQSAAVRRRRIFGLDFRRGDPSARIIIPPEEIVNEH